MKKSLLAFGFLAAATVGAHAAAVTINSNSFENPDVTVGNSWTNDLGDWTNDGDAGTSFIEFIGGFTADGVQHIGLQHDGVNPTTVYQDLGANFAPNTVYSLVAATGNRNASFTPVGATATYGIADSSGNILATIDAPAPATESTFEDGPTLTYTTPAAGGPTGPIRIVLIADPATPGRSHFDNVRLDASPIPEPVTTGFLALGSVLLLRRRRR